MTDPVPGVLVSEEEFARRFNARQAVVARANVARSDVVTVARVTKRVATHDRTRAIAREIAYIPGGVAAAARWFRENCTNAGYARDIAAAQAAGFPRPGSCSPTIPRWADGSSCGTWTSRSTPRESY